MPKFIIIFFSMILMISFVQAETIFASADSYVLSVNSAQNSNYGAETSLAVKNAAPSDNILESSSRKIYIRFSLASLGSNYSISQAQLNLTVVAGHGTSVTGTQIFNVYGLKDQNAGENWSETGITWVNAPANNVNSRYEMTSQATLLGTFSLTGNGTVGSTINFNQASLVDFLNSDTNDIVTLVITRQTYDSNISGYVHSFASKENGSYTVPSLTLQTTLNIPEPSTLLLGIIGIIFFFRKK